MKTQLEEIAESLIAKKEEAKMREKQRIEDEKKQKLDLLMSLFEIEFFNELPLFSEAGITYSAQFGKKLYDTFIKFERQESILTKECTLEVVINEGSLIYRLNATYSFGKWPKDEFLIYLYNELFIHEK